MRISVDLEKMRAEMGDPKPWGDRRAPGMLSHSELVALAAKLAGGTCAAMSRRCGKSEHSVHVLVGKARQVLCARDDLELGYIAYERGWVTIEEEPGQA